MSLRYGCILDLTAGLRAALMAIAILGLPAAGQGAQLRVSLPTDETDPGNDTRALFEGSLLQYMKSKHGNAFPYDRVSVVTHTYGTSATLFEEDTIAILTPLKFVVDNQALKNENKHVLQPLLIVVKGPVDLPYYPALFIVNNRSKIDSLDDPDIKNLFLVSETSTSGYLAPLYKLWTSGIISRPSLDAARARGWNVEYKQAHGRVCNDVAKDPSALGAVWTIEGCQGVQVLVAYDLFPQDVIVTSGNLAPYEKSIKAFFREDRSRTLLRKPPFEIRDVKDFNLEYRNAYAELERKWKTVSKAQAATMAPVFIQVFVAFAACLSVRLLKRSEMSVKRPVTWHAVKSVIDSLILFAAVYIGVLKVPRFGLQLNELSLTTVCTFFLFGVLLAWIDVVEIVMRMFGVLVGISRQAEGQAAANRD